MNRTKLILWAALGLLGACQGAPSDAKPSARNTADERAIGALLIATQVTDSSVDRVEYTVRSTTVNGKSLTGTLAVADGLAQGQVQVPQGAALNVDLRYLSAGVARCEGLARGLAVEAGRTSQVNIVPHCGAELLSGGRNTAPRIDAVFASRRSVRFGEEVAVSVSASDKDGDRLRYSWSESIAGAGFADSKSALTTWKAGPRAIKRNVLQVVVSDGRASSKPATLEMNFDSIVVTAGTCNEPTPIAVGQTIRGFTVGAPSQHAANACSSDPAPEHVYKIVLKKQQDLSVSVAGSAFFARLHVRREQCALPGAEVACDEFGQQRIDLPAAQPGTYFVFVDGDGAFGQGEYQLSVFSGMPPESCRNFSDDDADGLVDCADPDCERTAGCLDCAFDCDPNPSDCLGGQCDRFSGTCNVFVNFGGTCDADNNPATTEMCGDRGVCAAVICGNGTIELGEQCDDGNLNAGDSCDANCLIIPTCGNGILEPGEECEDGNTFPGDGCEPDCRVLAVCGNSIFEGFEECDDGNTLPGDGCNATCRLERCGDTVCDDGNPCTANICADAASSTCSFVNVDGTACELDGLPETLEQCRAGVCTAPTPDRALVILDPAVLAQPAFSLRAMHNRLAADGDGALLFEQWASTLTVATRINGRTAGARPGFGAFLQSLPRDTSGRIDIDQAGFLPSALVNRFDLRTPGNCGENRLVFTKTSGVTDGSNRGTVIFEFNVPDDGSNCQNALARWTALRALSEEQLPAAAVALLEAFALPAQLKTLRTNEFVNAPFWELREFHLVDGQIVPAPVVDAVPFTLAQNPMFRSFVVENAVELNRGAREIGLIPREFLDAASRADGETLNLGTIVPSVPGLEANVDVMSCSGCHLTRTNTSFVHVSERTADAPSALSSFMRSELDFRGRDIATFLAR